MDEAQQITRAGFAGLRVVSFESRRAADVEKLIKQMGGKPFVAPSMREVPLESQAEALYFGERLFAGTIDMLILLTGVGTRTLVQALAAKYGREEIIGALSGLTLVARGPKPVLALEELALKPTLTVPEPNTWHEILAVLDQKTPLKGLHVAVQEYGDSNEDLLKGLKDRGAEVVRVPVYRWALPENLEPLRGAVRLICEGQADVLVFTSSAQARHLLQVAETMDLKEAFFKAAQKCVIASVGPICTEELTREGFSVDIQPASPHVGPLLREASQKSKGLLRSKRGE